MSSLALLLTLAIPMQDAPALQPVNLTRTFTVGESQAYMASAKMKASAIEGEIKMEGEIALTVKSADGDGAKIEVEMKSMKMSFAGQEMPSDDMPKPKISDFTKFGVPAAMEADDEDNPLSFVYPAFYLPGKQVEIGKSFEFSYTTADGKTKLSGEGKLIATGMLYEEHVAKVQMKMEVAPKDDSPATYEYIAYFNSKSGKVVKAEGTITADSEELGGKFTAEFVVAKVRKKTSASFLPANEKELAWK